MIVYVLALTCSGLMSTWHFRCILKETPFEKYAVTPTPTVCLQEYKLEITSKIVSTSLPSTKPHHWRPEDL